MNKTNVVFKLLYTPDTPINVEFLIPSKIAGLTAKDLRTLSIDIGAVRVRAEEIFDIDCYNAIDKDPKNIAILFAGNGTEKLWFVGRDMDNGTIVVQGNVGPLAGYKMRGGRIIVRGEAREWLGSSMSGGIIEVYGSARDFVGARPFSSLSDNCMSGGKIFVYGNSGSFVGLGMCRGYIEILGSARDFVGLRMRGGTIVVHGSVGVYPALEMLHGLIVIGKSAEAIAPGFYRVELDRSNEVFEGRSCGLEMYVGDGLVDGQGVLILLND